MSSLCCDVIPATCSQSSFTWHWKISLFTIQAIKKERLYFKIVTFKVTSSGKVKHHFAELTFVKIQKVNTIRIITRPKTAHSWKIPWIEWLSSEKTSQTYLWSTRPRFYSYLMFHWGMLNTSSWWWAMENEYTLCMTISLPNRILLETVQDPLFLKEVSLCVYCKPSFLMVYHTPNFPFKLME